VQKPIKLQKISEIVRKYVPQEKQQQTSYTVEKKEAINLTGAWRLLQNINHAINEDQFGVGLVEAHNFSERAKDGRTDSDNSRDALLRLLLRSNGGKLFAGFLQLLHGAVGCVGLLAMA
jgi:hypothetical protein